MASSAALSDEYSRMRESSASSLKALQESNSDLHRRYGQLFRAKVGYETEYQHRYKAPPLRSSTTELKTARDIPIGGHSESLMPSNSVTASKKMRSSRPQTNSWVNHSHGEAKVKTAPTSTRDEHFAWPGATGGTAVVSKDISRTSSSRTKRTYTSEYKEKYRKWPLPQSPERSSFQLSAESKCQSSGTFRDSDLRTDSVEPHSDSNANGPSCNSNDNGHPNDSSDSNMKSDAHSTVEIPPMEFHDKDWMPSRDLTVNYRRPVNSTDNGSSTHQKSQSSKEHSVPRIGAPTVRSRKTSNITSEYKDKFKEWEIHTPPSSPPRTTSNPLGLSADALDSSKWKSFAKEAMEEAAQAAACGEDDGRVAGNPSSAEILRVPPPSNFAWPVGDVVKRGPLDLSQTHTETHDSYHAWPLAEPARIVRKDSTNPLGLSADALDSSKWKSFAKEAMEEAAQAAACGEDDGRVAGNPSSAEILRVPPPSNFAWPVGDVVKRGPLDLSQTHTETHDSYHAWPLAEPARIVRKDSTNPLGLSADALDSSKWKSFAKEAMEEAAQAAACGEDDGRVAGNPSSAEILRVPPPSNFAWPVGDVVKRGPLDLSQTHTETHDSYHAWPLAEPARIVRKDSTNPLGLSADALDSSKWKTFAKEAMEEAAQAAACGEDDGRVAGNPSSADILEGPRPSNFAWPVPEATDKRELDFKDCHTEYRDNYHAWVLSKAKSLAREDTNPFEVSTTHSNVRNWKSEAKDQMEQATQNCLSSSEGPTAGLASQVCVTSPNNFAWPTPEAPTRAPLKYTNCHSEYRDSYHTHPLPTQTAVSPKPTRNPMGLSADDLDASNWISESRDRMEQAQHCHDEDKSQNRVSPIRPSESPAPSNFAWPVPPAHHDVANTSNHHTEYRDEFHEWNTAKASALSIPAPRNPICTSSDAVDSSKWKSEAQMAMEQSAKKDETEGEPVFGITTSAELLTLPAPTNFAWPEIKGCSRGPGGVNRGHTEYRDSYISWSDAKAAKSAKPSDHDIIDSSNGDILGAIPSGANGAPTVKLESSTEYRDQYQPWAKQIVGVLTPVNTDVNKTKTHSEIDSSPPHSSGEYDQIGPPDSDYSSINAKLQIPTESTAGLTSEQLANRKVNSSVKFAWPHEKSKALAYGDDAKLAGKSEYDDKYKQWPVTSKPAIIRTLDTNITTMPACHGRDEQKAEECVVDSKLDSRSTLSNIEENAPTPPLPQVPPQISTRKDSQVDTPLSSMRATDEIGHTHDVSSQRRGRTDITTSISRRSKSVDRTSAVRKCRTAVLPTNMKFQGKSEYQDNFVSPDISTYHSTAAVPVNVFIGGNVPFYDRNDPKTIAAKAQTEHRRSYVWPDSYLLHQHDQTPRSPTSQADLTCKSDAICDRSSLRAESSPTSSHVHDIGAGHIEEKSSDSVHSIQTDSVGYVAAKESEKIPSERLQKAAATSADSTRSVCDSRNSSSSIGVSTSSRSSNRWNVGDTIRATRNANRIGLREDVSYRTKLRNHGRPQSAPTRFRGRDMSFSERASMNPLFANARYPPGPESKSQRWTTETRRSYTWKR